MSAGGWLIPLFVVVVLATGCASAKQSQLQESVRKAARIPVSEASNDVAAVFRDLAKAGGLDPATVYVALQRSDGLNAASVGKHHFYVTRGVIASNDTCLLTGIAAHEIAHDILKHAERSATTSDVTSVFTTILGTAAGFVVPGAGDLVSAASTVGLNAYSRSQESAADAMAITLLRGAGKPDWLLRYALEILQRESKSGRGPSWLSTHPAIADRIAAQPAGDLEEVSRLCETSDDQGKTPSSR